MENRGWELGLRGQGLGVRGQELVGKENWVLNIGHCLLLLLLGMFVSSCVGSSEDTTLPPAELVTFNNPILAGFNPDPSICRVGEDYYLVTSTFAYFPGIPILHSKDLVNWNQIGSAITRTSQLDLTEQGFSRGLYAPTIAFHDDKYYITCTQVDLGGNFIVTADRPEGPYSQPYWLPEVNGIDPSLFFDEDGKVYIVYNSIPPDNVSLYGGHRTIRMYELDSDSLTVKGEEHLLINGGTDIEKEPVWIEAPHIYKRNGYYYLMAAEGGTSYNHSEVIFRSKDILGPYEVFDNNPILTQRHLDTTRAKPITSTGHADIVELPSGEWWAVFLGCRPYQGGHYNTGRETFLAPVRWENGWPVINPDFDEVQYQYPIPTTTNKTKAIRPLNGNFTYRDDFSSDFDKRWYFLRNVKEQWYTHDQKAGTFTLQLRPETIAAKGNPSALLQVQPHLYGYAQTQLSFSAQNEVEMAGLLVLQNDRHYYFINKAGDQLQLLKKTETGYETLSSVAYSAKSVHLRIEASGNHYHFYYSENGNDFKLLAENVDATHLSTQSAGGFVGCMYGLYASSNGQDSDNEATFEYFELQTKEAVYDQ